MMIQGFIKQFFRLGFTSLCIIMPLLFCALNTAAQQFKFDGNRKKQTISFQLIKNLIVIPVYINGAGPYNFLLDTGVAQTIITDTTLLKNLNVLRFHPVKVQGYGFGEEVEAIFTRDINISVGNATILNVPTAIFKKDIFDLSSYLGVKVHGIIGYYFFNSFIVKINYFSSKLTIYDPETNLKIKGSKIPVEIVNGKPYIKAAISINDLNDEVIELMVDNGSSHPMLLESLNQKTFPLPATTIPANLGVGINGVVNGAMGRVNILKIGDFKFKEVLSGFPDFNSQRTSIDGQARNGSLGADVMRRFLVTFDYQHGFMYLKKGSFFKEGFEHDMSGLEIYVKQENKPRFYIGRIEEGSPGDHAGLQINDEIASIDFRETRIYTLSEVNELLKSRDGKQVLLEIIRKNERYYVLMVLKRRI